MVNTLQTLLLRIGGEVKCREDGRCLIDFLWRICGCETEVSLYSSAAFLWWICGDEWGVETGSGHFL